MKKSLGAHRWPLTLIALYLVGLAWFIERQIFAWIDANGRQQSSQAEIAVLNAHSNTIVSGGETEKAPNFVAESETQAIASFDADVRSTISMMGGSVVSSRSEHKSDTSEDNSIIISAIFDGDIGVVQSTLYELETGSPSIYLDKVSVTLENGETASINPVLRVTLSLNSRWSAKP